MHKINLKTSKIGQSWWVLFCALLLAPILTGCDKIAVYPPTLTLSPAVHTPLPTHTPTPTPTITPTPAVTPDCPNLADPMVSISVDPVALAVGDTLTVTYTTLPKFAGLAETSLLVDSTRVAVLGQSQLEISDPSTFQTLPGTKGNSLGSGKFIVQAVGPGTVNVQVRVFGDAEFCSYVNEQCGCGTTFKSTVSDPVSITVWSPKD